jgi:hypothetical protein
METAQQNQTREITEILLRIPGSFAIQVALWPRTRSVDTPGYYLGVSSMTPIRVVPKKGIQLFGVHQCACFTVRRKSNDDDLAKFNTLVPSIEGLGRILWIGQVRTYETSTKKKSRGFKFYIPARLWTPPDSYGRDSVHMTAVVHSDTTGEKESRLLLSVPRILRQDIVSY